MCISGCGSTLIENYDPDLFATVGIQCFQCGTINWTPELAAGEILSAKTLSFGDSGRFLINDTINTSEGVIVTCSQEIHREHALTTPRETSTPLILSEIGIRDLIEKYDCIIGGIIGGKFHLQRKYVANSGNSQVREFPFAWAVVHIEQCLARGILDFHRRDTRIAMMWLQTFSNVVGCWAHHPRFQIIARDLGKPNSFLHTCSQFNVAHYLYRLGNRIGLSLEDKHGEPNPDLYIRGVLGAKTYLEVKAPKYLQYSEDNSLYPDNVESAARRCIKNSSGQINRFRRGVLVVSSSHDAPDFHELLERKIKNYLTLMGQKHKDLAAVIGLSSIFSVTQQGGAINAESGFRCSVTLNESFDGKNPVVTERPISVAR